MSINVRSNCRIFFVIIFICFFCSLLSIISDIFFSAILFSLDFDNQVDLSLAFYSSLSFLSFNSLLILFPFSFRLISILYSSLKRPTPSMPASAATDDNVIPDQIVVSDDDFDALDAPLANELLERALNVQPVEPGHYRYEEVW